MKSIAGARWYLSKQPSILLCALTAFLVFAGFSRAELIPSDRLTDWTPGVRVGVPGGIPNRTRLIDVTAPPYNADKSGGNDSSEAIQAAINAAAANDVIYLPAGTYRLNSSIGLKSDVTLRGEGMTATVLKTYGSAGVSANGTSFSFWAEADGPIVTTGLSKGSTMIGLADTSAYQVGDELGIAPQNPTSQFNDPVVVHVSGYDYLRNQKVIVTAKTSTTLSFWPPLYDNWTSFTTRVSHGRPLVRVGLESLTVNGIESSAVFTVSFSTCYASWIKDVKVQGARNYTIQFADVVNCEIRRSFLDRQNRGSGSNGAGFLVQKSSAILFEDNVILTSFPSIEVNFGTSGCVFAYNFLLNDDPTTLGVDTNHGPHNQFNLYEGNIIPNLQSDGYFGSNSHETIFRNWFTAISGGQETYALSLKRFSRNFSLVGNIFASPNYTLPYDGTSFGQPNIGNGSSSGTAPPWADWGKSPGPGGFQELDLGVQASLIRKGNYDYFNKAIPSTEALGGEPLPNSLYLGSKPPWFGDLNWPPFNPVAPGSPVFTQIPAGYRYVNGTHPSGASAGGSSAPIPIPTPAPIPTPTPTQIPTPTPIPNAPATPSEPQGGLAAAYRFDEGSGTSALDSSGNGNTGVISGTTTAPGKFGNALNFNGTSDWVSVNASPSLNISSAMTLEAWIYPTANQKGWRTIIQRQLLAYWLHASSDNGTLRPATGGTFGGGESWFSSPSSILANAWTHLASTYDGATLRLYVNGNLVASRSVTGSIQPTSNPLWIGGNGPFGEHFQGRIDEVRIYNRALTQAEIQADMNTDLR